MVRPQAVVVVPDPGLRALTEEACRSLDVEVRTADDLLKAYEPQGGASAEILVVDLDDVAETLPQRGEPSTPADTRPVVIALAEPGSTGGLPAAPLLAALDELIDKPVGAERLQWCLGRAVEQVRLRRRLQRMTEGLRQQDGYHGVVGPSAPMERIRDELRRLERSRQPVWFEGEPGTGKKSVARMLHALSGELGEAGGNGNFVVAGCEGLDEAGWRQRWIGGGDDGLVSQARGGTLYLDELPEAPAGLQDWLLDQLRAQPEGGSLLSGSRVIVGSRLGATSALEAGRLSDALARELGATSIPLPPLRERREDIGPLARHFIGVIGEINQLGPIRLSPDALAVLESHAWPGNVQELRNTIEHAMILATGGEIRATDLPERILHASRGEAASESRGGRADQSFRAAKRDVIDAFERVYLQDLLTLHGGNVTVAAQQAGMLRSALQRLLRKHRLKSADFRTSRRTAAERTRGPAEADPPR